MTLPTNKKLSMSLDDIQIVEKQNKTPEEKQVIELTNENHSLLLTVQNLLKKNEQLESQNDGLNKTLANALKNLKICVKHRQNTETQLWQLQNKYNENQEIITLYNWIFHIDSYSKEFISGYRHNNTKEYITSTILHKIPMSTYILVITENESIYCLPYYESHK